MQQNESFRMIYGQIIHFAWSDSGKAMLSSTNDTTINR